MQLRRLQNSDAEYMLEWIKDPEINQFFRFDADSYTIEDAVSFIEEANRGMDDQKVFHYAITENGGEYLGTISLKEIDCTSGNAEYALSTRRKIYGSGIAVLATKEILRIAFEEFGLHKVYLNVLSENVRAVSFYEKMHFVYEGKWREHICVHGKMQSLCWYSILREEWKHNGKDNA